MIPINKESFIPKVNFVLFLDSNIFTENYGKYYFLKLKKSIAPIKLVLLFGVSLAIITFLVQWAEYKISIVAHSTEIYLGVLSLVFTALGIWLALTIATPKTVVLEKIRVVEKSMDFERNDKLILELGISDREMEVLVAISEGLTNQQIADKLFVSLNTVKTHTSNLFMKLEVNRRTQAIDFAKKNALIS